MNEPITNEDWADRTIMELNAEVKLLRGFIIQLANRIADASDVLGKLAERKEVRNKSSDSR